MNYCSVGTIKEINIRSKIKRTLMQKVRIQKVFVTFAGTANYSIVVNESDKYNLFTNLKNQKLSVTPIKKNQEFGVNGSCEKVLDLLYKVYEDKQLIKIVINESNEIIEWNIINE